MSFSKFLDQLLSSAAKLGKPAQDTTKVPHFEEPTGYYTVRGEPFSNLYIAWMKSRVLDRQQALTLGREPFEANLANRSGYVRELCLRALQLLDDVTAIKPVLQRLNDYVPSNRELAHQLVLRWMAQIPLEGLVELLPEIDALKLQSRVRWEPIAQAQSQRLDTDAGQEALLAGLMSQRAMVRRACWQRCVDVRGWSGPERIHYAMQCGDPAIARSVEADVLALPDSDLVQWFPTLRSVRAMALRRACLMALHRRELLGLQTLISFALRDDSFSIRWLGRHWGRQDPTFLLQNYLAVMQDEESGLRVKRYALEGMAALRLPGAVEGCKAAFQHPHPAIRKAALAALCANDEAHQSMHVDAALRDDEAMVVREALRQIAALGMPLPVEAIAVAVGKRRDDVRFFEVLLQCASHMPIWKALHLATFVARASQTVQSALKPLVTSFLSRIPAIEVYDAPSPAQWQAISVWAPVQNLSQRSGLRMVIAYYAEKMGR
ncbi:MAG: HEAT repeat domain-containing protein [Rhodoferax sp.]